MTTLITPLPTPPTRQDSANFNDRADAFLGALPLFQQEANALAVDVQAAVDAVEIARQAVVSVANVTKWVSGTTYTLGTAVWSPITGGAYRRITVTGFGTTDPSLDTVNYKAITGAQSVEYIPVGTSAAATTVQSKLREFVSITDSGAVVGTDATTNIIAALVDSDFVTIPPGEFLTSGITISTNKTIKFDGGTLKSVSASSRIFTVTGGAKLTIINPQLRGYRLTNDSDKTNHGIVIDNGYIAIEGVGEISYFAGWGVFMISGGSSSIITTIGSGITVTENGGGIYTGEYEYFSLDGCTVTRNGLNVTKTDWSNIAGARTGWGITGRFSNGSIKNCTVNGNAIGIELNSQGGSNPDHGKIVGNTINHNYAAGLILQNLHSYETVISNTILSNVVHTEAPDVTFAATGTSFDYIEVNCIGLQVAFNDIGSGSGGYIPIYGHGRCRYICNNLVGVPFSEISHPQVGSMLRDFYGYDKNGDNLFFGNMIRSEGTAGLKQVILTDSVRTVVKDEIQSAGAGSGSGGGRLIDDVEYPIALAANWSSMPGGQTSWVARRSTKFVDLYVYAKPSAGASSTLTTLPSEYRPIVNNVQLMAAVGNTLSNSYATVNTSGGVTIVGAVTNEPVLIHGTYVIK